MVIGTVMKASEVWHEDDPVLFKSQWGWDPEKWGFLAFTSKGRRDNLAKSLRSPFVGLIYSTHSVEKHQVDLAGKVCGFYIVSDQRAGRADYALQATQPDENASRWLYGLRPYSAFSFLPEQRRLANTLFEEFNEHNTWRSIGHHGRELDPKDPRLAELRELDVQEVALFRPWSEQPSKNVPERQCLPWTKAGPQQKNGYWVEPTDPDLPRNLYIMRLTGNEEHFLKQPAQGRLIIKLGLSYNPDMRLDALRWHMPDGRYYWERMELDDVSIGLRPYSFEAARAGEDEMKKFLGEIDDSHLGNEFYAATREQIDAAWRRGHAAAQNYKKAGHSIQQG